MWTKQVSTKGYSKTANNITRTEQVAIDTSRITILNLKTDWWLTKKLNTTKAFSLTNADIKAIEEVFKAAVSKHNLDTSYFHYKRQYVPFIDKDGQKKVWINCFCAEQDDNEFINWKKSVVIVDDGGSCFFNFIVKLADKIFYNLEVNGVG